MGTFQQAMRRTNRRGAQPRPVVTPPARSLLTQADFSYLGYYDVIDGLTAAGLGAGLAVRTVSGTPYLMFLESDGTLQSFPVPGSFGTTVNGQTGGFNFSGVDLSVGGLAPLRVGIWWDEPRGKIWINWAYDYPNGDQLFYTSTFYNADLSSDGTVTNLVGDWGLQNVGQRTHCGGVRAVPTWFQSAYSVGPYMTGFGGYTSRLDQGLHPGLGPFFAFFPYPNGVYTPEVYTTSNGGIPEGDYKISADGRGSNGTSDWYTDYAGRTLDRGVRATTDVTNYFDSGAYTSEGGQTIAPTLWTSPAPNDPDGYGRWTWGDTYDGTAAWIDNDAGTRSKHGLVTVANLGTGAVWYQMSDLHFIDRDYEIHVYNPAVIGEAVLGTRPPWNVRPTYAWSIRSLLEGVPTGEGQGSSQQARHISGVAFNSITSRLYLGLYGVSAGVNAAKLRVYVFSVAGG